MDASVPALRAFLAVAEELHFGRAATKLFTSSPSLSQQISRLERQLGVVLFERSSRSVGLTAAGSNFVPLAREMVVANERINQWALSNARSGAALRIGFVSVAPAEFVTRVLSELSVRTHGADVRLQHFRRDDLLSALTMGVLDAAFLWGPAHGDGVRAFPAAHAERVLLVAQSNPIGHLESVHFAQTETDRFLINAGFDEALTQWWLGEPRSNGFRALRGEVTHDLEEAMAQVAMGAGVYVTVKPVADAFRHPGVVSVPIADAGECPLNVCVREGDSREVVAQFERSVRVAMREQLDSSQSEFR